MMLALTSLTYAQTAAKKEDKPIELPKDEVIAFLKTQRDIIPIQERYDQAFKAEPAVAAFTAKVKDLQKLCGSQTFNPQTVTCEVAKAPAPPVPAVSK